MEKSLKINIPEGYEVDSEKSTFTEIVFKPINSLNTWEECIKKFENQVEKFYCIGKYSNILYVNTPIINIDSRNYNLLPSKEIAEKFLVLQKLYTCRQAYIGDWKPDYSNHFLCKYCITTEDNNINIHTNFRVTKMFSFPTRELAIKFLNNFKEDLEFIKELL